MSDIAIRVEGLSKQYRIGGKVKTYATLQESVLQLGSKFAGIFARNGRREQEENLFWALKDISFEVKHGEVVGIIGRNGAGKSTLLKILSRITTPTEGYAQILGRVGSLLEVGTGFHPELTGRENIYLNGAILGMERAEIGRKFDEIVAFAGLERFIDTPVKRYSSGMYVRLAFAVAAHLEPEILIVDEVLAVGDAAFQKKCLGKMGEVARQGRTVLFVSHNMGAVQRLCGRAIQLNDGTIVRQGPVGQVIEGYLSSGTLVRGERVWTDPAEMPGDDVARLAAVRVKNAQGRVSSEFLIHEPIDFEIEYEVLTPGYILEAGYYLYNDQGVLVFISNSEYGNKWRHRPRAVGKYQETCHIPGDFLNEGRFTIHVGISVPPWTRHAQADDAISFKVVDDFLGGARGSYSRDWPGGAVRPLLQWTSKYIPPKGDSLPGCASGEGTDKEG